MRNWQQFIFQGTAQEVIEHVRWCRREFGARGHDWDFDGGNRRVTIRIRANQHATFYTLKFGNHSEKLS